MSKYVVSTRDVDGGDSRRYKLFDGARKRFEEMVGYTMESAISDQFWQRIEQGLPVPAAESIGYLRAVSMYGCVVTLSKE